MWASVRVRVVWYVRSPAHMHTRTSCRQGGGDAWGVCDPHANPRRCTWHYARVDGFRLYQDKHLYYPFAVQASEQQQHQAAPALYGTVLVWEGEESFRQGLVHCDRIEGYTPGQDDGLYHRTVVEATILERCTDPDQGDSMAPNPLAGTRVRSYLYYQEPGTAHLESDGVMYFEGGDWLVGKEFQGEPREETDEEEEGEMQ